MEIYPKDLKRKAQFEEGVFNKKPRLPTFRLSTLHDQWRLLAFRVYDGCMRLCSAPEMYDCKEAKTFVKNDYYLLRDSFGLRQILLKSEKEQMQLETEIQSEGVVPKPKKIIDTIKVQVLQVKVGLDPPTGCSMSSMMTNIIKTKSLRSEDLQEKFLCVLKLKNSPEEDAVKLHPGSRDAHTLFPDSHRDYLIVEIRDSKGEHFGRVLVQVADISGDGTNQELWWPIHREPDRELVGHIKLCLNYSKIADDINRLMNDSIYETVAYDLVLEVAMKVQDFQQRKLLLQDPWKWLLTEFTSHYGISVIYTKLRYLSYVMDVATPTTDCLKLVYDLLEPVITKNSNASLSCLENRLLGETKAKIELLLALTFENYSSLDESPSSGIIEDFRPASGNAAPALKPAVELYSLLHDISTPEAKITLCRYFQAATNKRATRYLSDTDEYITPDGCLMDIESAYLKMKTLCINLKDEIDSDIKIQRQNILPSFVELPHLSASIYSTKLCQKLQAFLKSCPPSALSPHVKELVIATSDFERNTMAIGPNRGGVDANELFSFYILDWIKKERQSVLQNLNKKMLHNTFVDDTYTLLKKILTKYEFIISRWPEYALDLLKAIVNIEKAIVEALEKQHDDELARLTGRSFVTFVKEAYVVPHEVGILLISLKRMLDFLHPSIKYQFKLLGLSWSKDTHTMLDEQLDEVSGILRIKFQNYLQAIVKKLVENTKLKKDTKLKHILQDSNENRILPLQKQLADNINHLHKVYESETGVFCESETAVFIAICQGYWDQMGKELLSLLAKQPLKSFKGFKVAVNVLNETFVPQMQKLLGDAIKERDMEVPTSIKEVLSMLPK